MTQSKRVAVCILRYLKDELTNPSVSDESKESLEVAIQCLESVYEVGPDDLSALAVKMSLPEMFKECTGNERMCFKPAQQSAASQSTSAAPRKAKVPPSPEAEAAKQQGNDLLKAEKYQEALEMYSKAIDLDPNNAVYFCNRAAAFSKLDKSSEAIEDCQAALEIDPTYSKAYGRMGIAYAYMGDHEKAYDCYKKALQLDPNNESYKNNLRVAMEQINAARGVPPADDSVGGPGAGPGVGFPGPGGIGGNMPDISQLLGNPALMGMATQIMQDPNVQNLMSSIMSGMLNTGSQPTTPSQPPSGAGGGHTETQGGGGGVAGVGVGTGNIGGGVGAGFDVSSILRAGQQFAQQMQMSNGPLIDQLRREIESRGLNVPNRDNPSNDQQQQPPPPPPNNP